MNEITPLPVKISAIRGVFIICSFYYCILYARFLLRTVEHAPLIIRIIIFVAVSYP